MIYHCLIHKPTNSFAGIFDGRLDGWRGLSGSADWACVSIDIEPMACDFVVDLRDGLSVLASDISPALVEGE